MFNTFADLYVVQDMFSTFADYYVAPNSYKSVTDCELCHAKSDNNGHCPITGDCPLKIGYYFKKR